MSIAQVMRANLWTRPSHRKSLPYLCPLYFNSRSAELGNALATEVRYHNIMGKGGAF